jgi:hypothetical protein
MCNLRCGRVLAAAIGLAMLFSTGRLAAEPKKPSDAEIQKIKDAIPDKATATPAKPRKLLVFSRCQGFVHDSIPYGEAAIKLMGEKTGAYTTVLSSDMAAFEPEKLQEFDAVFFNNATQLNFDDADKKPNAVRRKALLDFVQNGKGVVGCHAAVDCFYGWPEAAAVLGAVFAGHPGNQFDCPVKLDDPCHPLLKAFGGKGFWIHDEMYKMKEPYSRDKLRVLLSFDMSKLPNDKEKVYRQDKDNAIAWIHEVGRGREFYCSLGHRNEIFWNKPLLQFYLDGIQYALGDLKVDATPSAQLATQPAAALAPEK